MYSAEKSLGSNRLGIFADQYLENSFIVKNSDTVFARMNKINGKWVVWFYKKHLQKTFPKLREAIDYVNKDFISWVRGKN